MHNPSYLFFSPKKLNLNLSKALGLTSGVQGVQVTGERHGPQTAPQEAKAKLRARNILEAN